MPIETPDIVQYGKIAVAAGAAAGAAMYVGKEAAKTAISYVTKEVIDKYRDYRARQLEIAAQQKEARELFDHLFGPAALVRACWTGGHPDNRVAREQLSYCLGYYDFEQVEDQDGSMRHVNYDSARTIFGGPNSTPLTKAVWEFDGVDDRHLDRSPTASLPLRFWGISNDDDERIPNDYRLNYLRADHTTTPKNHPWSFVPYPYVDALHPGRLYTPKPDALISTDGPFPIYTTKNNYLLVTRLPNILGSGRPVLFEGNNGIGTRAAELLLDASAAQYLRAIDDEVGAHQPFQALFEATTIEATKNGHRMTKLHEPIIHPIEISEAQYSAAREKTKAALGLK